MTTNGLHGDASGEPGLAVELATILPGDVVDFTGTGSAVVKTVLLCNEVLNGLRTEWRWIFLEDGSLLELAPKGLFRYREHRVLEQGTALYQELVAQDGVLVRFERRVRNGTSAQRPVHVSIDGRRYRVRYTGTVEAERLGEAPELAPWRSFRTDPEQNVYFGLQATENETNAVLGLWTAQVCLSFGEPLSLADIGSVYRKG